MRNVIEYIHGLRYVDDVYNRNGMRIPTPEQIKESQDWVWSIILSNRFDHQPPIGGSIPEELHLTMEDILSL